MLWTHLRRPWRRISPRRNSGHRGGPSSARRSHRLRRRIVVGLRARCSMVAVGKESSTIAMASANLLPRPGWVAVIDRLATSFSRGAGADASLLHASHVRWAPGDKRKTGFEITFHPSRRDGKPSCVDGYPSTEVLGYYQPSLRDSPEGRSSGASTGSGPLCSEGRSRLFPRSGNRPGVHAGYRGDSAPADCQARFTGLLCRTPKPEPGVNARA